MISRAEALRRSTIYYVDLPNTIEGITSPDGNRYIIAINRALSEARQRFSLEHELAHIRFDHFYCEKSIEEVEREADEIAAQAIAEMTLTAEG